MFGKQKDITRNVYYEFFSSLSTKKLKPTNNTLYLENKKNKNIKKIEFFFLFIFIGTEMPNSGKIQGIHMIKEYFFKKLISSLFFRTVMYQTIKCMQSLLYEEIKRPYQKSVF